MNPSTFNGARSIAPHVPGSPVSARPLPKYISLHHTGAYDIRLKRGGVQYRARVRTLERALACVEKFIAAAGAARTSNTGLTGISESVRWSHNRAYPAFCVSAPGNIRRVLRFTAFGGNRRRTLRAAVALRSRLTGERITDQQIEEALAHV